MARRWAALALAGFGLLGCDGRAPASAVRPAELAAARAGGAETWEPFCARTRGERITWHATVVDSRRQFGDDFMESGLLLLDTDAPADGRPDAVVELRPSQVKALARGQGVTIEGILRGCELEGSDRVLRIEPVKIG